MYWFISCQARGLVLLMFGFSLGWGPGLLVVNVLREGNRSGHVVAVCCSVLQCVAVCCSVLQCVAVCVHTPRCVLGKGKSSDHSCCSVLQCVCTPCAVPWVEVIVMITVVAVCCSAWAHDHIYAQCPG